MTGPALARRGMIYFAAGAAVIIITYLLWSAGAGPISRFGPFAPMCAGAYVLVLGVEKMVSGLRALLADSDVRARPAFWWMALSCLGLVVATVSAGAWAWQHRAPYWSAIEARNRGNQAVDKLRSIAERQAAAIQSGAAGREALTSWQTTAAGALALRPDFAAALESARYLETRAGGRLATQAKIDVRFFGLCVEWMDLYESVQREIATVSMTEPPEDWGRRQNDIIDRIQALPAHPQEGL